MPEPQAPERYVIHDANTKAYLYSGGRWGPDKKEARIFPTLSDARDQQQAIIDVQAVVERVPKEALIFYLTAELDHYPIVLI
jgi:hypothetical protein